jgi:hypothetical protein
MKTIFTLLVATTISLTAFANSSDAYKKAMGKALSEMKTSRTVDELTNTANQFQRIAKASQDEWLPLYYHAQCYVLMGFNTDREADERDGYLDLAQNSIDEAMEVSSNESEIYALQSMLHTARLVIDPMSRGQKMMGASGKAIGQSLALDPKNPRAQYLLLSNEVGQAQFFGKDPAEYCGRINTLNTNWDDLNQSPEFYPKWGKGQISDMANNCK